MSHTSEFGLVEPDSGSKMHHLLSLVKQGDLRAARMVAGSERYPRGIDRTPFKLAEGDTTVLTMQVGDIKVCRENWKVKIVSRADKRSSWSREDLELLEAGLKKHSSSDPERWDKIAATIPGKSKAEVVARYSTPGSYKVRVRARLSFGVCVKPA